VDVLGPAREAVSIFFEIARVAGRPNSWVGARKWRFGSCQSSRGASGFVSFGCKSFVRTQFTGYFWRFGVAKVVDGLVAGLLPKVLYGFSGS
jgi:hypothetical protein